jgi:hypothetical protein
MLVEEAVGDAMADPDILPPVGTVVDVAVLEELVFDGLTMLNGAVQDLS